MENDNPHIPYSGDNINNNPWNDFENNWLFHQFDNYLNGGALWQAAYPGESQYSEWSQQMVSTMYQNWYNSAPNAMKRAIDAGINPYTAAQGIAGVGNSGVASAPPAVNAPNLAEIISSSASGLSSLGSAFGNTAQGIATLGKLRHEIDNIDADTSKMFQDMGFTALQSRALSTQLKYLDKKEQIGVWQALASFEKTKQEYNNLFAQYRNIVAQYEEIIAHKDLLIAQEGEVKAQQLVDKAMKDKLVAEANWQNIENKFFLSHGYKLGSPVYDAIHDQMVSDGTFDLEKYGDIIAGYEGKVEYAISSSHYRADNETAYQRAHNAGMGQYDSDPYQQKYRNAYDVLDSLSDQEQYCNDILVELKNACDDGKISQDEYKIQSDKVRQTLRSIQNSAKEIEKTLAKMHYSVNHASKLDDIEKELVKLGLPHFNNKTYTSTNYYGNRTFKSKGK